MKVPMALSILTQGYTAAVGIIFMPLYLHLLGSEAFGLIGLFLMAQAWIQIVDMGFTQVISRDIARMRAGGLLETEAMERLRSLEWLFATLTVLTLALVLGTQHLIATHWIHAQEIDIATITSSLTLIAVAVVFRWFAGLYRGVLIGLEKQNRVNMLLVVFATLRFVGVFVVLIIVDPTPIVFFVYQAVVSSIELLVNRYVVVRQLPNHASLRFRMEAIKSMLPTVMSMSFLNIVWIASTQLDKLFLSGVLNLTNYGYFTLGATAASGILMLVIPFNQVVQPRLSFLVARNNEKELEELYRLASQFAVIGFVSIGVGLAFFAEPVLRIWTGSPEMAGIIAPILFWYSLRNSIIGVMLAPFMLQFARGSLRLHVLINAVLLIFLVPALFFAAQWQGGIGTGKVLFVASLFSLLLWSPVVHRFFMPRLKWRWLFGDTLPVSAIIAAIVWLAASNQPSFHQPILVLAWAVVAILASMFIGVLTGSHTRQFLFQQMRRLK